MKIPQVPPKAVQNPSESAEKPVRKLTARERASPEMIKAAEGIEAQFTEMMMKAMRDTVDESEFSLHNSATNIYQNMLDEEYADKSAHVSPLGLSDQILEYLLRSQPSPQYNKHKDPGAQAKQSARPAHPGTPRTGGTDHEG